MAAIRYILNIHRSVIKKIYMPIRVYKTWYRYSFLDWFLLLPLMMIMIKICSDKPNILQKSAQYQIFKYNLKLYIKVVKNWISSSLSLDTQNLRKKSLILVYSHFRFPTDVVIISIPKLYHASAIMEVV